MTGQPSKATVASVHSLAQNNTDEIKKIWDKVDLQALNDRATARAIEDLQREVAELKKAARFTPEALQRAVDQVSELGLEPTPELRAPEQTRVPRLEDFFQAAECDEDGWVYLVQSGTVFRIRGSLRQQWGWSEATQSDIDWDNKVTPAEAREQMRGQS